MKFKLKPDYFTDRIPLVIYRKDSTIYFQLQHEIVGADRYRGGVFVEYDKITAESVTEIGLTAKKLLDRFHEISDFDPKELEKMLAENSSELLNQNNTNYLEFINAKNYNKLEADYDHCSIRYNIPDDRYTFTLWWYKKRSTGNCSESTGEKGILTFDTPLEFTDYSDTEMLGKIIVEALDRSRRITDKVAGDPYPEKNIELANGSTLIVSAPRDKHFADNDDYGVCELYQAYMYYPREDSEEASAVFYIGIAEELDGEITEEGVLRSWEKQYGKAEEFTFTKADHGIFVYRAEMKNKKLHRIAYFTYPEMTEDRVSLDILDCVMELRKPNSRKRLDEKLSVIFEQFALKCCIK